MGLHLHFRAARLPLPGELFQRLGQRQAVQAMRAQLAEQGADMAMNALGFLLDVAHALALRVLRLAGAVAQQIGGAHANRLQRLAQLVVQLTRQLGLFLLAHRQQPAAELALALAGGVQLGRQGVQRLRDAVELAQGKARQRQRLAVVFQRADGGFDAPGRRQRAANGQPAGHQRDGADHHGEQDHAAGIADFFFDFAVGLQRHMHHMAIQIQRNRLAVKLHLRGQRRQPAGGFILRRRIRPAAQTQGDMAKAASRHQLAHPRRVGVGAAQGVDQLQQPGRGAQLFFGVGARGVQPVQADAGDQQEGEQAHPGGQALA